MRKIEKTTFAVIAAALITLVFAVGCGSESPAATPTAVAATLVPSPVVAATLVPSPVITSTPSPTAPPSGQAVAAQDDPSPAEALERQCLASLPDPSADGGNVEDFTAFMDEELRQLFQEFPQTAQCELLGMWLGITTVAPREDWEMILGDIVRDFPGRIAEARSDPISPPFILGLLPPKYREAYNLLPEGSWARAYMDRKLGSFSQEGWDAMQSQDIEPYPTLVPALDARDEADLMQMLREAGGEEWLVEKVRSLDADAAQEFQAAADVEERFEVLRRLVEMEGKRWEVLEIREEWQMRSAQLSEEQIADLIENVYRPSVAEMEARSEMTPTEFYLNSAESFICGDLMNHIVGQHPRTATTGPAECDIDKVVALTRAALDAGQAATSEEEFRNAIEYYEETGQWRFSVPSSSSQGAPDTSTAASTSAQPSPAAAAGDLPIAVQILPPVYHRAYRLLPTEGPWTRRYIAGFFDGFDYEEWEQLPWEDEFQLGYQPTLDASEEAIKIIPMLQAAERDPDAEAWLLTKVEAFAPEAAEQLRSAQDITARVDVFRKLVEVDGFEWEVEALSIEWGGKEAGQPDEFIAQLIELLRADYEYSTDVSISWKQRIMDGYKSDVCNLVLGLILGGEYPQSVIIGRPSWCDIDMAIELAEEALLANDGQPATSEDDIREWMESDAQ